MNRPNKLKCYEIKKSAEKIPKRKIINNSRNFLAVSSWRLKIFWGFFEASNVVPDHFINLPFCQIGISSTLNFINRQFCQLAILTNWYFINLQCHQLSILPTCHFNKFHLCNLQFQLTISAILNLCNLQFHQLAISLARNFISLQFHQPAFHQLAISSTSKNSIDRKQAKLGEGKSTSLLRVRAPWHSN